jgi:hypothetical protein
MGLAVSLEPATLGWNETDNLSVDLVDVLTPLLGGSVLAVNSDSGESIDVVNQGCLFSRAAPVPDECHWSEKIKPAFLFNLPSTSPGPCQPESDAFFFIFFHKSSYENNYIKIEFQEKNVILAPIPENNGGSVSKRRSAMSGPPRMLCNRRP